MIALLLQDPSSIDPFSDKWTQLKVPAQVHIFVKSLDTFELIQQLDLDRVTSVTNSDINGLSFKYFNFNTFFKKQTSSL